MGARRRVGRFHVFTSEFSVLIRTRFALLHVNLPTQKRNVERGKQNTISAHPVSVESSRNGGITQPCVALFVFDFLAMALPCSFLVRFLPSRAGISFVPTYFAFFNCNLFPRGRDTRDKTERGKKKGHRLPHRDRAVLTRFASRGGSFIPIEEQRRSKT